jgi:hypothetical protein
MKRFVRLLIVAVLLACQSIAFAPSAMSHADGKGEEQAHSNQQQETDDYTFVAAKSQSLSVLVRRALQLYDEQNTDLSLTTAAAMYAETNIVKRMGSRWLHIGEHVTIQRSIVEEFAQKSQQLSAARLAAWQTYANRATFELDHIRTVKMSSARTDQSSSPSDAQTDTGTGGAAKSDRHEKDKGVASEVTDKRPGMRQSLPALWWFAGLLALGGMYHLLERRAPK